jgi:hypothetical protein
MLDKLFGWGKKKPEHPEPEIQFGRYSDNNKPVGKVSRWTEADNLFKEKKFHESFDAFFDYLADDNAKNVVHERSGTEGRFHFYQGSKIVRGSYNNDHLNAEVTLARMPQPSVPVMRRLLEMNFNLYYGRYALDGERLCMRFESGVETSNPNKLYYGLKELSTKADKQDDLLVQDFSALQTLDTEHIIEIPIAEKEIKYEYLQKWIKETLDYITTLDADKLSGGIAYLLLTLTYRIDYLIIPEGKLMNELESIVDIYFKKDDRPTAEKNRDMIEGYKKIQAKTKEAVFPFLFRSKHTFAIVTPQVYKTIADVIYNANQNIAWYRDNNHPFIAEKIAEYGISYCQFSYSLPRPVSELYGILMRVNYSDYYAALGFHERLYVSGSKSFESEIILEKIALIQDKWKSKYPLLNFRTGNLKFDNLTNFNQTFTTEIEFLNLEAK